MFVVGQGRWGWVEGGIGLGVDPMIRHLRIHTSSNLESRRRAGSMGPSPTTRGKSISLFICLFVLIWVDDRISHAANKYLCNSVRNRSTPLHEHTYTTTHYKIQGAGHRGQRGALWGRHPPLGQGQVRSGAGGGTTFTHICGCAGPLLNRIKMERPNRTQSTR